MTKHYYNCLLLALGIGVGSCYTWGWGYYLALGLLFVGLLSLGVFDIRLGYFVPTLCRLKNKQKRQVVLTFDDGPTELTPLFLDLLKQYEAKAIFFCIGRQIAQYPQIVQRIKEEGHLIGNHTYSHIPQNCFASTAVMTQEIQQTDALLAQLGIVTPYFRPPYGVTNPHIAKAAKRMGKIVVGWDIRSLDTVIKDETRLWSRVVSKLNQGNIILMHDTSERTLHVLEQLLKYLKANDYQVVLDL
ncbi:polysaccharide deacetylase family protein [Capnocytophaga granulosa]|uniref:polysaccharide deacetylase family protein n=1 Tax=Capnocytophaga granulosa TaxID=45242 RepID=UPI0023F07849|nr:polysaccharide deacetylase family protein [Capnocytophaga granulosa]